MSYSNWETEFELQFTVSFKKKLSAVDFHKIIEFFNSIVINDAEVPGDTVELISCYSDYNRRRKDLPIDIKFADYKAQVFDILYYYTLYCETDGEELLIPFDDEKDFIDSVKAIICATPGLEEKLSPSDVIVEWEGKSMQDLIDSAYQDYYSDMEERDAAAYEYWQDRHYSETIDVKQVVHKILEGISVRNVLEEITGEEK